MVGVDMRPDKLLPSLYSGTGVIEFTAKKQAQLAFSGECLRSKQEAGSWYLAKTVQVLDFSSNKWVFHQISIVNGVVFAEANTMG